MKEYILNIEFENWTNQLWFMNNDDEKTKEKWNEAISNIDSIRNSSKSAIEFQDKVIDKFKKLGFIRVQK